MELWGDRGVYLSYARVYPNAERDNHKGWRKTVLASTEPDPGQLGHYEIREKIAEGGFGIVYLAYDTRLHREVALKVLHPYHASEPARVARFVREAQSAAKLNHPGIVQIYDVIEVEGHMALVIEFVRGSSLDHYLKEHPGLSLEERIEIAAQVADTLDAAHKNGIIHRDVKPANVMIDLSGRVKLTDFSLARLVDYSLTPLTGENNVLGTPAYMSPEQCQGYEAGPQSDLYSLGVMLYEMVTGHLPFEAENYLALLRHHTDTPPTPVRLIKPNLPVALEQVIMRCLSKTIAKRPASGEELAQILRDLVRNRFYEDHYDPAASKTVALNVSLVEEMNSPPQISPAAPPTPTPMPMPPPAPTPIPAMPTPPEMAVPAPMPMPATPTPPEIAVPAPMPMTATPTPPEMAAPAPYPPTAAPRSTGKGWKYAALAACFALVLVLALVFWRLLGPDGLPAVDSLLGNSPEKPFASDPVMSLREYVTAHDSNYEYSLHSRIPGTGYTAHVLEMTSQTWHSDKAMPPVWRHWLTIITPDRIVSDKAMLVSTEGLSTAQRPLSQVPAILLAMSLTTKSVVAILEGFPLDPAGFHNDPEHGEDIAADDFAILSFTRFLDTSDPTWTIAFPQVKSAVRAMDTIQHYISEELRIKTPIDKFVLTGEANGWGTWLTGVVDNRVAGIAPIQFDPLNLVEQIRHQIGQRTGLTGFLSRMSDLDVMPALDTAAGRQLLALIDPYEYRDHLTMPKLILLPSNRNPYTTIDGANLYFKELKGEKHLFCAPNVAYSRTNPFLPQQGRVAIAPTNNPAAPLAMQDFRESLQVFYHRIIGEQPMPQLDWDIQPDGAFKVSADGGPSEARLWVATSDERDFDDEEENGAESQPPVWSTSRLTALGREGNYNGKVRQGALKFTAFFIEVVYPSVLGFNFSLTTPTNILTAQEEPSKILEQTDPYAPLAPGPYSSINYPPKQPAWNAGTSTETTRQ